jgi:hypothetical protein
MNTFQGVLETNNQCTLINSISGSLTVIYMPYETTEKRNDQITSRKCSPYLKALE